MTILNNAITLSNVTAASIVVPDNQRQIVHLHNMEKSSSRYIHIGSSDITLTNSIHLDPGESIKIEVPAGDTLWALSDPDGLVVGVLQVQNQD
jgi:hypothetical protein